MAIVEARKKAEAALGAKFDLRHFHDTNRQLGSAPPPMLRARIDRWIADGDRVLTNSHGPAFMDILPQR